MAKNYQGEPAEELSLGTYIKLIRASNTALNYTKTALDNVGLSTSQFAVLEALHHVGPLCLGDLARRILKSSGNLTLVVDNLEKRGLAKRKQEGDDKRFTMATITPAGRKLIARIFPEHSRQISEIMSRLTPDEQETLGVLCRKLGKGG
ncbi:MAG TPA: MarR family transcriptional regulator [Candidatus Angelobacter sp.]|nr:MarR family transcriptional regulator [Candidatus Angelobacter sp.]